MLPPTIPLFPLPNVVLFPNVFLPLHIYEPRYREMVADALAGDRIIGMVLLQPGHEHEYAGRPPVYGVGCAGVITHAEPLAEGRFNIVLRGLERFRIANEERGRPYRLAHVEAFPESSLADADRAAIRPLRQKLEALIVAAVERSGSDPRFPPALPDEDLINALAQYLQFDPLERQALLERENTLTRCRGLVELLEIKTIARTWKGGCVQ